MTPMISSSEIVTPGEVPDAGPEVGVKAYEVDVTPSWSVQVNPSPELLLSCSV